MVAIKTFLTLLTLAGAGYAVAIPEIASGSLEARTDIEERAARPVTCKNTGGNFKIDLNNAEGAIHQAPASEYKEGSGYPHTHHNFENKIKFTNKRCNAIGVKLLEFPVFPDGHFYQYTKKPKPDTGDARAIYIATSKDFCGVISHTEKPTKANGNNKGDFALCT